MISKNLRRIKKIQFQLQNNPTLDEAESSKRFAQFEAEVARAIRKQAKVSQKTVDEILLILSKADVNPEALSFLGKIFKPFINVVKKSVFFSFLVWSGNRGGEAALIRLNSDKAFDLRNDEIIDALERRGLAASKLYDETTKKQIISVISEGREMQLTNFEISELLAEKFIKISANRAGVIAFNELANAVNLVEFETFKRNGVTRIRWVTVLDERVCPICDPLHNEVVGIGSNFVGTRDDNIVFTGPRPPAHVSCRCFLEEVIEGFEVREEQIVWTGQ